MNIAMVSVLAGPLATGGSQNDSLALHVTELARELGRKGHQVAVYTHRDGLATDDRLRFAPGVTVEQVSAGDARPMSAEDFMPHIAEFAQHLARHWSADRPDVIHAHHWLSGLAALSGARDLDIPVVHSFHELAALERRAGHAASPARLRLEKAIGRGVRALVATTESERAGLVRLGVPRPRIALVPSGIDVERFSPAGPALPGGHAPRLLALARPGDRQGVATTIKALARIPDAELVVVGGAPIEELGGDPDIHRLRIVAKEAGVVDRVTFLGRVEPADMPSLLRSVDVTVSLPTYETFGEIAVQSMACGVPVIVSAVGGHLDTVIDDVTGIHMPAGRPLELARRIRALFSEPTQMTALGIAGADRAQSRFAWERIAAETLKVYESVLPVPEPVMTELDEAESGTSEHPELEYAAAS